MLRREMSGETLNDETLALMTGENLEAAYDIAKAHDVVHLYADALIHSGKVEEGTKLYRNLSRKRMLAVYRVTNFEYECDALYKVFEDNRIPFIPLKGSVMRNMYREAWMRTSCDIDILVKVSDLERAIKAVVTDLRYTLVSEGWHDIALNAPSGVHFELHFDTISHDGVAATAPRVLSKIWHDAKRAEGSRYHYELSPEMFYFYHIAHMVQHFQNGGCGIRPFIDIFVLKDKLPLDRERLDALLKKGGLVTFEKEAKALSDYWFKNSTENPSAGFEDMAEFIITGGVYGNLKNHSFITVGRKGKFGSVMNLIFLPYGRMRLKFPILKKHRWLLPFYWIKRGVRSVFKGRGLKNFDTVTSVDKEDVKRASEMMDRLDLK